jgi:ferredoxin--NADP+ reductase
MSVDAEQDGPRDPSGRAPMLPGIVAQRIDLAPGLMILRVAPEGWQLPDFLPGQYVVLGLPVRAPRCEGSDPEPPGDAPDKLIRRAYSIASSSVAHEYLEFYINLVQSGELTPRLFHLAVGKPLWVGRKITGMFTLQAVPKEKHLVLVATGTGVAPYMSMVRTVLADEPARRFAILHGARHSRDLGYHAELTALERAHPQFSYLPIVSRPDSEPTPWVGCTGHCQDLWTRGAIEHVWGVPVSPDNAHVFLCGNPAMIEQMLALLVSQGYREHTRRVPGQVHLEKYW